MDQTRKMRLNQDNALLKHLKARRISDQARSIGYAELSDDIALIFIALDQAINPRLLIGDFMISDCTNPAHSNQYDLIMRPYSTGAIIDAPDRAPPSAHAFEDGIWKFYTQKK